MFKKIFYFELAGFILVAVSGFFLYYLYEWSSRNPAAALISPVNESYWEYLKLLFIPMLFFSVFEYFIIGKRYDSFIPAKAIGVITGLCAFICLAYTYSGIIGKRFPVIDILVFFFSVLIAYIISYYIIRNFNLLGRLSKWCSIFIVLALITIFITFTYIPPYLNLFLDPYSKGYGLP